jgi:hypothetical protein
MPAINSGRLFYPTIENTFVASTTVNMSATTDIVAAICQVPQTGTVTGMKFCTGTVTTGCTLSGTIETVTAAAPSTTLYHANATGTVVVDNTDDSVTKTVTFAGNVSVTKGDLIAITLRVSSGTPSALGIRTSVCGFLSNHPIQYQNIATVSGWGTNTPNMVLTYNTGDMPPVHMAAFPTNNNISASSSTSPDEVGIYFQAAFSAKTDGYVFRTGTANNAENIDVILYDSSNNVLASQSLSKEAIDGCGTNSFIHGVWPTDANIIKGRYYRLILKPTTTTTWTNLTANTTSNIVQAYDGVANPVYTSRTDAGAWTETADAQAPLALSISQIYQAGGSYF